jgi:hypothetical protein
MAAKRRKLYQELGTTDVSSLSVRMFQPIAMKVTAVRRRGGVRFPAEGRMFLPHRAQTGSGAHPAS